MIKVLNILLFNVSNEFDTFNTTSLRLEIIKQGSLASGGKDLEQEFQEQGS